MFLWVDLYSYFQYGTSLGISYHPHFHSCFFPSELGMLAGNYSLTEHTDARTNCLWTAKLIKTICWITFWRVWLFIYLLTSLTLQKRTGFRAFQVCFSHPSSTIKLVVMFIRKWRIVVNKNEAVVNLYQTNYFLN